MRVITTQNNGNIYEMDAREATDIVEAYKRVNGFDDLQDALQDMHDRAILGELPVIQRVACRRFKREQARLAQA